MKREKSTIRNLLPLAALPFILLICFVLLDYTIEDRLSVSVDGENGVWDLRGFDFENQNADLETYVEYIPNALLTPKEFAAREDEAVIGATDRETCLTSRIHILVPDDGHYTFTRLSIDFSHRLYVNGEWLMDVGRPGDSSEADTPDTGLIVFTAQAKNGVIEIVSQSSNFIHREGGNHQGWTIGKGSALVGAIRSMDFQTNIVLGCYLMLFLLFILLFFMMSKNRTPLYFALFCLMWFFRVGVTGRRVFTWLMPWLDWYAKFRIEYIALPVAAILTVAIINVLFPGILQKYFRRAVYVVSTGFATLFLLADTLLMSRVIFVIYILYGLAILYIVVRFVMKLRGIQLEQWIFLAGAALFMFSASWDFLFYSNLLPPLLPISDATMSNIMVLVFTLCEASAVFISAVREMEKAEVENAMLKENIRLTERQIDMQRTQYIRLMENVERAKHVRHDMHHQLATIVQLSDEEPVKGYVENLLGALPDVTDAIYCENIAVNAVVNHYASLAADKSISVDVRLDIPENIGLVIAIDLCVLIGNLMENAVEACRRMSRGDRFIRVRSRIQAGGLSIVIENSFDGIWNKHDGVYISRKTNNAGTPRNGVGLSSVQAICDKYDGMFKVEVNNQSWKASALLEMGV
jgi:hypothetical protein